ncbi:MAG: hypothetical protein ACTH31_01775 [Pseudoclavibacter sp.]
MSAHERRPTDGTRRPLPVPDGGWPALRRSCLIVAVLWAIAMWAAMALVLPHMDIECASINDVTVCPAPDDRNPLLAHLLEPVWPAVHELVAAALVFVPMLLGAGIATFLDAPTPWHDIAGAPNGVGFLAGGAGAGAGVAVAGLGYPHPLAAVCISGIGVLLCAATWLGARWFARILRRRHAVHLRRHGLREHGTRYVGRVSSVEFRNMWFGDDLAFTVTATIDEPDGPRDVTARLLAPKLLAPVEGGTVLVYVDDVVGHHTGVDAQLEVDPESILDPDAARYGDASPS